MSATQLLDRLDRAKQTAPGRWIARCPAHEDKRPSLSIRELDDGRVLINCFGGCGALEVLDSVGLDWAALFPQSQTLRGSRPSQSRIPARDLLEIVSEEATLVAIFAEEMLQRRSLSESDWARFLLAARRIWRVRDHAHAG